MKTLIPSLIAGALMTGTLMAFSSIALADCPLNMPEEKLVECLTVEGSGENYQDYRQLLQSEMTDMSEQSAAVTQAEKETEAQRQRASMNSIAFGEL